MPELPDVTIYVEALERRVIGQVLEDVRIVNPFLLRTVDPAVTSVIGQRAVALKRLGKRIAIGFENDHWLILHLMIAGRLHWKPRRSKSRKTMLAHSPTAATAKRPALPAKVGLAGFDFSNGTLILTEAGSKRRASLHVVASSFGLQWHDPGGLDVFKTTIDQFTRALVRENHTVKRVLTDPHAFSGIGNSYSDEILHAARLSPIKQTQKLTPEEIERLFEATRKTLRLWIERLRTETGDEFPEGVTAFREGMAVHGRFGQPCPACGALVQRIRYADNETNYCARCQTDGQVLADRSLSRLLKGDWPRSIDEWE